MKKTYGTDHKLHQSLENWGLPPSKYFTATESIKMGEKTKVLKIKVGEVFIDGKTHNVFQTAWEQTSKKGDKFYSLSSPIFVNEIEKKEGA